MNDQVRSNEGVWKSVLFAAMIQICWLLQYVFETGSPFAIICAAILTAELYLNPEFFRHRPITFRLHCSMIVISWIFAAILIALEWM